MSLPKKLLDYQGLATLSEFIKQAMEASDDNSSGVSSLREDLQELTSQLAAVLAEVGDCIQELDSTKAYIAVRKDISLDASGWEEDASGENFEYGYKYVLAIAGVTAEARADLVLDDISSSLAGAYGVSPVCNTVENAVVFKSRKIPEDVLSGHLYLTQGAAESAEITE